VSGVPEPPLPTLKTGNGESRSWVQIPPHPFFWNGFFSAVDALFRSTGGGPKRRRLAPLPRQPQLRGVQAASRGGLPTR